MNYSAITTEQQYYEIEDFWKPENISAVEIERIKQVTQHIPPDVQSVLDVGCGGGIWLNYLLELSRSFTRLCGVDRSLKALNYVQSEKYAGVIDSLPFESREFDLVASLEVLEHIPVPIYEKALKEITRISGKYVMISVPNNQNLDSSLVICPLCYTRYNPNFHMRSYDKEKLVGLLDNLNYKCIDFFEIYCVGSYKWLDKIKWNIIKKDKAPPPFAICPMCGYRNSNKANIKNADVYVTRKSVVKKILKKLWPKEMRYQWIAAVYARQD